MLQSKGSHVVDINGNILLDLCSTENIPLGHNAEIFTSVSQDLLMLKANSLISIFRKFLLKSISTLLS